MIFSSNKKLIELTSNLKKKTCNKIIKIKKQYENKKKDI